MRGLPRVGEETPADLFLELDPARLGAWPASPSEAPCYESPRRNREGQPLLRVWRIGDEQGHLFRYQDGTEIRVSEDGRYVSARWPAALTLEDVVPYLLGPVMGFVLSLRGQVCLHASVIRVGAAAVAFVGPRGAGKSTLAASLARRGHAVLSDDVLLLDAQRGSVMAVPSFPLLRLWPDSAQALFGDAGALPRLCPSWDKRVLDLGTERCPFQATPLPLGVVYLLGDREDSLACPRLEDVSPARALAAFLGNTYAGYLYDAPRRARAFAFYPRLLQQISVRSVVAHASPARLEPLCELLLADAAPRVASLGELRDVHSMSCGELDERQPSRLASPRSGSGTPW